MYSLSTLENSPEHKIAFSQEHMQISSFFVVEYVNKYICHKYGKLLIQCRYLPNKTTENMKKKAKIPQKSRK